jgi:hypothetical protein
MKYDHFIVYVPESKLFSSYSEWINSDDDAIGGEKAVVLPVMSERAENDALYKLRERNIDDLSFNEAMKIILEACKEDMNEF